MRIFYRGKSARLRADKAVRNIGSGLKERACSMPLYLYAEASAATLDARLISRFADDVLTVVPMPDDIPVLVRAAWNEFRLLDRPIWRAMEQSIAPDGGQSVTFFYDDSFIDGDTFDIRLRNWALLKFGPEALKALAR